MAKCLTGYITRAGQEKEDRSSGNHTACGRDNAFGGPRAAAYDGAEQGGILCFVKVMNTDISVVSSGKDMSPQDSCQRRVGPSLWKRIFSSSWNPNCGVDELQQYISEILPILLLNKTGSWNEDKKGIQLSSASLLIEWKLSQLEVKDSFLGTHETKPNQKKLKVDGRKQLYTNKRTD